MDSIKSGEWKKLFALDNASFLALIILFTLLPLFFVPSAFVSFPFSKAILVSVGVIIATIFFIIVTLKNGALSFVRSWFFLALLLLPIVYLLSALLGKVPKMSIIGYGFETGTFISILLMVMLTYLVSVIFQNIRRLRWLYLLFFAVALLLALFHLGRFWFGSQFLSFGYFPDLFSNTIGKYYEIGVFFSISVLLSVTALDSLKLKMLARLCLYAILLLSLAMVAIINLSFLWYVIGILSLILFIYYISYDAVSTTMNVVSTELETGEMRFKSSGRKIAISTLIVIVVSVLFILPVGKDISNSLDQRIGLNNIEIRPSWIATYDIFKQTMKSSPLLGAGPNRFSAEWQLYRPDVNLTNFWNVGFDHGIGFIPTAIIETGFLGIVAWFAFFLLILYVGYKSLLARSTEKLLRYFSVSSFIVTVFLWTIHIIYTPTTVTLALAFFFTGLFFASAIQGGFIRTSVVSFFKFPKLSFAFVMISVCVLIASVVVGYFNLEKLWASTYFQKAIYAVSNEQNPDKSSQMLIKALSLVGNDLYYRSLVELDITNLNSILSDVSAGNTITDQTKERFQNVLSQALQASGLAQQNDPTNFENWLSAARIYETIMPVGVPQAYESAKTSYEEAIKRSPRNPALYLALARIEALNNNLVKAEEYIQKTLVLKENYAEAIFLQSQIDLAKGNVQASINNVEKIALISPNEPSVYFRLGLLKYNIHDFKGAISVFEKAITLVPVYANAKYFLGLSYQKVGRQADAIGQFENLHKDNPENKEISLILNNLKADKEPFANATSPISSKPEQRKALPVEENN